MSLHTLVLAAGRGSRFDGGFKQLAMIDGQAMVQRAAALAESITPDYVTVILGYEHAQLSPLIAPVPHLINPHWQAGIGSSIAFGVAALPASASAVLIYLSDQVALTAADLKCLVEAYDASINNESINSESRNYPSPSIVCAAYAGDLGVPAIFPRAYFSQLIALDGDRGAKHLLHQHPVRRLIMESAAIDIDTYAQWLDFTAQRKISNHNQRGNHS